MAHRPQAVTGPMIGLGGIQAQDGDEVDAGKDGRQGNTADAVVGQGLGFVAMQGGE